MDLQSSRKLAIEAGNPKMADVTDLNKHEVEELSKKAASWVFWCLLENRGMTQDSKRLSSIVEILTYTFEMAQEIGYSPTNANVEEYFPTAHCILTIAFLPVIDAGKLSIEAENEIKSDLREEKTGEILLESFHEILNLFEQDKKQVIYPIYLGFRYLYENKFFYLISEYIDLLIKNIEALENNFQPEDYFEIGVTTAGFLRELKSNEESYNYLNKISHLLHHVRPELQVTYYISLANSLKDLGQRYEALKIYELAESIAVIHLPEALGHINHHLGRLYLEEGKDVEKAFYYLSKSESLLDKSKHSMSKKSLDYMMWVFNKASIADIYIQQNDYVNALKLTQETLSFLPEEPSYTEESIIHHKIALIARSTLLNNAQEWSARMSLVAAALGGREREIAACYSEMASASFGGFQGAETLYWLSKSLSQTDAAGEQFGKSIILHNVAYAEYLFNLREESLVHFEQAIELARQQNSVGDLIAQLYQYSLASLTLKPDASRLALEEAERFRRTESSLTRSASRQNGYSIACKLLHQSADVLNLWPETLRTTQKRLTGNLETLQMLLDKHHESIAAFGQRFIESLDKQKQLTPEQQELVQAQFGITSETKSPVVQLRAMIQQQMVGADSAENISAIIRVRAELFQYLCERGYLDFLKRFLGIQPHEVLEWVISKAKNKTLRNRIYLEYLVNPSGSIQAVRRGYQSQKPIVKQLSRLKALMMKFFLYRDLQNIQIDLDKLPHSYDENNFQIARDELADFYLKWRNEFAIQSPNELVEAFLDRSPKTPKESEKKKQIFDEWNENISSLLESFSKDGSKVANPSKLSEQRLLELIQQAAQIKQMGGVSAKDYGIHINNFLDIELFERVASLRKSFSQRLPVVVDYFQAASIGYWFCVDLENDNPLDSAIIESVLISRKELKEIVNDLLTIINLVERGKENYNILLNQSVAQLIQFQFLSPLLKNIEAGREIWLGLASPLSAIPVEQLPFDSQGNSLVDFYPVTRRDPFSRWLEDISPQTLQISSDWAVVFGDPQGDTSNSYELPAAREEAVAVADFLGLNPVIGADCTVENFKQLLPGKAVIHLACHGHHFKELGDFPTLVMSDGYVIGQELAYLDLSQCQLAVLSACDSARGRQYGTSPIESLAIYLLEAGVKTVLASTTAVNDNRALGSMRIFYEQILQGQLPSSAVSKAFGREQRNKHKVCLYPWVLFGKNIPLLISKG